MADDTLTKAIQQDHLTPETVNAQFCSDWLKAEIRRLFAQLIQAREAQKQWKLTSDAQEGSLESFRRERDELNAQLAAYREATKDACVALAQIEAELYGTRYDNCVDVARELRRAIADARQSRQGCTCSLAAAGHDKHCAMRTSDERKETPTERAERAYQMQQEMRKANARVREVIAKSSSKESTDG